MEEKRLNIMVEENVFDNSIDSNSLDKSWELLRQLMQNSHATRKEIEGLSNIIQLKDNRIKDVEDKLSELEIKLSVYKERAKIQAEKIQDKDDLIASLTLGSTSVKVKMDNLLELFSTIRDQQQKAEYEENLKKKDERITELESNIKSNDDKLKNQDSKIVALEKKVKTLIENNHRVEEVEKQIRFYSDYGMIKMQMYVPGLAPFVPTVDNKIVGPGWIVIHRRINGKVSFNVTLEEYQKGFGNFGTNEEIWLGLERMHKITTHQQHELYIHYVDTSNEEFHARYDNFVVGSANEKYALKSLGKYEGNSRDMMRISIGCTFWKCPKYGNGWWDISQATPQCNLTGKWSDKSSNSFEFLYWGFGTGGKGYNNIKSVQMLIKPKSLQN